MTILAASSGAFDQPGTLGFLVVFGMGVLLFFVFRSMAKHLRKVNAAAEQDSAAEETDTDQLAASTGQDPASPR